MNLDIGSNQKRLFTLDYLRGLAALGIMVFHYTSWLHGKLGGQSFLGRVGVYGVSIFYILSGLTLYYVYREKFHDLNSISTFFIKRFFRIYPLLWLVMISTILLNRNLPPLQELFLNFTGLFGFLDWDSYIGVGVWSIGNELTFYVAFPFFMLTLKRSGLVFTILGLSIFAIYLFFAFLIIDPATDLSDQWRNYVNPLNQLFLFFSGIVVGHIFTQIPISTAVRLFLMLSSVLIFIFVPTGVEVVDTVFGINRIVFTALCIIICIAFFNFNVNLPPGLQRLLSSLGEASYSVYLLHPVVYRLVGIFLSKFTVIGPSTRFGISILVTLVGGYLVFNTFERHFMRLGKSVSARW